jgi:hypothetical protein
VRFGHNRTAKTASFYPQMKRLGRGVRLGNPHGARALKGKQVGNGQVVAAVNANAERHAQNVRP